MICLLLRDFATTQEKRLQPQLAGAPLILHQAGRNRPQVLALDAIGRQIGVKVGDTLRAARARLPEATFLAVDESRYRRIFSDITLQLLAITDRVEPEYQATSAVWYTDDALMLPYLLAALQNLTGMTAQVGSAAPKFPARVAAARAIQGTHIKVNTGDEAAFLAPFPVTLLPLNKKMRRRLPLLGLDTLGQLAALPNIAIWEQFGKHGRWLHDLARGKDIRPLTPIKPPEILREVQVFDDGITDWQTLHRVLERLSRGLIEQLQGREAHTLTLLIQLSPQGILEQQRQPHEAVRDTFYLTRLLTQMLDGLPITSAVTNIEVRLQEIRERVPVQLSLFDEPKPPLSLHEAAFIWAQRHQHADFYRLVVTGDSQPAELFVEKQKISSA